MQRLWMRIDLSGARAKVPWTAVRSYIRRSKAMVTHAIIKNVAVPSIPKVIEFLGRCPRLEHLELWVAHNQKDIYEKFKGCKTLKGLILSPDIDSNRDYLGKFLHALPQLERIELWSTRVVLGSDLTWPQHLPNLKSITLASEQSVQNDIAQYFHPVYIPGIEVRGLEMVRISLSHARLAPLIWSRTSNLPHTLTWKNYVCTGTLQSIELSNFLSFLQPLAFRLFAVLTFTG